MNLQEMINDYNNEEVVIDDERIELSSILSDNKYSLLLKYLNEHNLLLTNDIKRLSKQEYDRLKVNIPNQPGIGNIKVDLYIKKLDEIRKNQIKNSIDETNVVIKKEIEKRIPFITKIKRIFQKNSGNLKEEIIKNEKNILESVNKKSSLASKFFIKKIESFSNDGDVYKFLKSTSSQDSKNELYDEVHKKGLSTAVDIAEKYDPTKLIYTSINNLNIGDLVNTMTISAIADNFNHTLGMYYNENEDIVILKSQTNSGEYNNEWINDKELIYYLQNENPEKYRTLDFSHKANQICRDIIHKENNHTKVYLFNRTSKNEDYEFCGEVNIIGFLSNNKSILISKK